MDEPASYEYRGLMALTWDVLRGDTSGWPDRAFYREAIERYGQPALDVGCGTGRLLLDYLADGIDIDGVDISPEMLELCRAKAGRAGIAVNVVEQRMEHLDLPRRYRCIVVPSSSFQLLVDAAAAEQAMDRLFAHLEAEGALVMPFMTLWRAGDPLVTEWSTEVVRPEDGAQVSKRSVARFDPDSGLEHTEDLYEVHLDGRVVASERHGRSPATRSYTREEAVDLYQRHGFEQVEVLGPFVWEPAEEDDSVFCVVGRRPKAPVRGIR